MRAHSPTRRDVFGAVAAIAVAGATRAFAGDAIFVTVHRNPSCGCCLKWVSHLRDAGFVVEVIDEADISAVKTRLRVPPSLASCHTAEVGGYVVEGHAPAVSIRRLLDQKPNAIGLAVPGMPIGSPGMETRGTSDVYDVLLFDAEGSRGFAKFEGDREI